MMHKPVFHVPRSFHAGGMRRGRRRITRILRSNRWVLGLGIVLAVLLPEALHGFVEGWGRWFAAGTGPVEFSLVATVLSLVAAHVSLRRLGVLPLVDARTTIVPTLTASYSVVIVVFYAAGIPLEPYHFWTSFVLALAWYFAVSTYLGRHARPLVGLVGVPVEWAGELPANVNWCAIEAPLLDAGVDAVVIDPHAGFDLEWSRFITSLVLDGVPVYHRAHLVEGLTGRTRFENDAENNFGALLPSLVYARLKRVFDLAALVPAALVAGPILMAAAIAIKIDSKGPVFFHQTRVGFRGRLFVCHKLRTMRSELDGPSYTLENDSRITRLGRFLRKWRIDELPQMFNILKGDMSWIGPRPEARELAEDYARTVPFYDYRHAVRPGISGWAAVHQGNVALVDAATLKLEYDFYYIRYFSIWLDLLIAIKTLQTIWTGFGSR